MLSHAGIHTILCSLIAGELSTKNPALFAHLAVQDLTPDTLLREGDLALDSLSLTRTAIAAASFFDLYSVNRQELLLAGKSIGQWTESIAESYQLGADGIHFKSSGSTGLAKSVHHPSAFLLQEARAWAIQLAPLGLKRAVLACPAHHIYGCIWGVWLPQVLGIETLVVSPLALPACLRDGDLLITVPPVWDYLAPAGQHMPQRVLGINSTGPLREETRSTLAQGSQEVWEIYGSSETAGIASRPVTASHYTLLEHWARGAAAHTLVRRCPDGISRAFDLPDVVEWINPRELRPVKRRDQAIQIGGHNVSAQWVAEQIQQLPHVKACAVRAHLQGGDSFLKAFIVLDEDTETLRHDMAFLIRMQLPNYAMPKHLSFGSALPVNGMGKLIDWPLDAKQE